MPVIHPTAEAGLRVPNRSRLSAWAAAVFSAFAIALPSFPLLALGAEMQPRSYAYLLSHAHVAAVGTVTGVSGGFLSGGRKARIEIDGLYKGKVFAKEIEVHWDDKEFEETAFKDKGKVVVFLSLRKDTTYTLTAPAISCWPVEMVAIRGKPVRAVEYAYPMDLMTNVPASALRETEELEKSMNFQVTKRKQWILADQLLPPIHPVILPKPKPKPKAAVKSPPKTKAKAVKAAKPGKSGSGKSGTRKSWFIPAK